MPEFNAPQSCPPDVETKYFAQRYELWSKYDSGVAIDTESWYSATPESIATHIASRCWKWYGSRCTESTTQESRIAAQPSSLALGNEKNGPQLTFVDGMCGCGSNAIQLALFFDKIIAVDIDPRKIEMAQHNAKIYGVAKKIEFHTSDVFELLENELLPRFQKSNEETQQGGQEELCGVFLSPPWGGPLYSLTAYYDLRDTNPSTLDLVAACRGLTPNVVLYLPRNIRAEQATLLAHPPTQLPLCCIEHCMIRPPKAKATVVYYFGAHLPTERLVRSVPTPSDASQWPSGVLPSPIRGDELEKSMRDYVGQLIQNVPIKTNKVVP